MKTSEPPMWTFPCRPWRKRPGERSTPTPSPPVSSSECSDWERKERRLFTGSGSPVRTTWWPAISEPSGRGTNWAFLLPVKEAYCRAGPGTREGGRSSSTGAMPFPWEPWRQAAISSPPIPCPRRRGCSPSSRSTPEKRERWWSRWRTSSPP